jgi:hypothetical protein
MALPTVIILTSRYILPLKKQAGCCLDFLSCHTSYMEKIKIKMRKFSFDEQSLETPAFSRLNDYALLKKNKIALNIDNSNWE